MRLGIGLAVWMMLVACGAGNGDTGDTGTPDETTTPSPADQGIQPVVMKARADLSTHLAVEESSIETVSAERVTWSDGSLGCPEPGDFYTQALVEGSRIILQHDGRFFDYHAGPDGEPLLCESEAGDGGHDSVPPLQGVA